MVTDTPLRFVVNRHRATTLHFDLRLEVLSADGPTLPSWAVPKGPSLDPAVKRLAVRVDDHEIEHLDLEDEHKIVWDTGAYAPAEEPGPAIEAGHLRFLLAGHKLRGGFALTRTRMDGHDRHWLLLKIDDEHAEPGREWSSADMASVLSNRWLDVDR